MEYTLFKPSNPAESLILRACKRRHAIDAMGLFLFMWFKLPAPLSPQTPSARFQTDSIISTLFLRSSSTGLEKILNCCCCYQDYLVFPSIFKENDTGKTLGFAGEAGNGNSWFEKSSLFCHRHSIYLFYLVASCVESAGDRTLSILKCPSGAAIVSARLEIRPKSKSFVRLNEAKLRGVTFGREGGGSGKRMGSISLLNALRLRFALATNGHHPEETRCD